MGKICEFYKGKNVLVTGATGYCGKVLVEKLLRTCVGIGNIFIIVRRKKNASPKERYIAYINHLVFNGIRESNSELLQKIIVISGDLSVDGLDLDQVDEKNLINQVNLVFHCAGNVRFDEPLKAAINNNVIGTWRMLQLAVKMKNCQVFSHMSTAFSKCFQEHLDETYHPSLHDVWDVIKKTQELDDAKLHDLEIELLSTSKHPNTYTLSKAFGEDVVYSYREKLPIVIIRPAIVWPCVSEPIVGYLEGLHSGMGLISAAMTGVVRTVYVGETTKVKFTPGDFMINATIASAWKRSTSPPGELLFFNSSDTGYGPLTWRNLFEIASEHVYKYVSYEKMIWYPNVTFTTSYLIYVISVFLFQIVPSLLMDFVLLISGRKAVFTSLQMKIFNGAKSVEFFVCNKFQFDTKKLQELFAELDDEDQKKFFFNHWSIDVREYCRAAVIQCRRLLLKEDDSTIPMAQAKLRKLYYADLFLKGVGTAFVLYNIVKFSARLVD